MVSKVNVRTILPKLNGPGIHSSPPSSLLATGIVNAVYCPMMPKLKIALMAVDPAKARRPSNIATKTEAQTQFAGVFV